MLLEHGEEIVIPVGEAWDLALCDEGGAELGPVGERLLAHPRKGAGDDTPDPGCRRGRVRRPVPDLRVYPQMRMSTRGWPPARVSGGTMFPRPDHELLERGEQQLRLTELLWEARGLVVVEGEAGIGKTSLVRAALRGSDAQVLVVR